MPQQMAGLSGEEQHGPCWQVVPQAVALMCHSAVLPAAQYKCWQLDE